jgi:hypothetical protein
MADDLATDIRDTKVELQEVKAAIKTITTGDDAAVEALVKKLRFKDCDAALEDLRPKEARLEKLLILDKEEKARLQQQSGAGTSMLPVRQDVVMFPCRRLCCMPQQSLLFSKVMCLFVLEVRMTLAAIALCQKPCNVQQRQQSLVNVLFSSSHVQQVPQRLRNYHPA